MSTCSGVAATAARSKKVVGGGGEAASKEVPRQLSIHIYSTHIYIIYTYLHYLHISTQVAKWIRDISDLHRAKPAPTIHYSKTMPDIDNLMQVSSRYISQVTTH